MIDSSMENGLYGTHVATDIPVSIPLTDDELTLACSKGDIDGDWSIMCESVFKRTGYVIEGCLMIESIVIKGVVKDFH